MSGTLGFGYHFTDYLRADVNIGLLASDKYSARGFLNADPNYPQDYGCLGTMTVTTVTFDQGGAPVGEPAVEREARAEQCVEPRALSVVVDEGEQQRRGEEDGRLAAREGRVTGHEA